MIYSLKIITHLNLPLISDIIAHGFLTKVVNAFCYLEGENK